MIKTLWPLLLKIVIAITGFAVLVLVAARIYIVIYSHKFILPMVSQPDAQVAIVFGAGLRRDGSPTPILQDRVQTAVDLYKAGKVKKLLMSGDNRYLDYNEPGSMREYALSLGVPEQDIVLDYAGRRTYDTCYRAGYIFGITKAILVTQPFHLPRAIYTCRSMGMDATGMAAQNNNYSKLSQLYWNIREIPAMLVSIIQVNISHPLPVLGDKEYIFPR